MGGHDMPKVPDWRVYKVDANPAASYLEQMKGKHGPHYKDPWIRNEIWKFNRVKLSPLSWGMVTPMLLGAAFAVFLKKIEWSLSGHDDHH